jgi:hypothetical protein
MTTDPEPLTPEERFAAEHAFLFNHATGTPEEIASTLTAFTALRDMIDSDRFEMGILLTALTTLDNRVSGLESHDCTPDLGPLKPFIPPDPETVPVPRSLIDALVNWWEGVGKLSQLAAEYDAWKAGQQR